MFISVSGSIPGIVAPYIVGVLTKNVKWIKIDPNPFTGIKLG